MKNILVFLADGFEEAEAICPIDVLKRAKFNVVTAGVGSKTVTSSHNVKIDADYELEKLPGKDWDAVFCPGGMPGAVNLSQSWLVNKMIIETYDRGGIVSAICASPAVVLAPLGLLNGKKATCYPGCESYAPEYKFSSDGVVVDNRIVTGKSAGYAFDLALGLIELLDKKELKEKVQQSIYYKE